MGPRWPQHSRAPSRTKLHRYGVALRLALALALVGAWLVPVAREVPAEAAVRSAFQSVYSADDNGAIAIVGNAQMTCSAAANGCTNARAGSGASINNNNFVMGFIDADSVAATTNSTSTEVALPAGSEVLYARLIWGARLTAGTSGSAGTGAPGTAKFRAPGATAYTTITASKLVRPPELTGATDASPYQAGLDVTTTVRNGGNGTYWFADMVACHRRRPVRRLVVDLAYRNPRCRCAT